MERYAAYHTAWNQFFRINPFHFVLKSASCGTSIIVKIVFFWYLDFVIKHLHLLQFLKFSSVSDLIHVKQEQHLNT